MFYVLFLFLFLCCSILASFILLDKLSGLVLFYLLMFFFIVFWVLDQCETFLCD